MNVDDILVLSYVQDMKNNHAYELERQREQAEQQAQLAAELNAMRQFRSESEFRQRIALIHGNYSAKLAEMQAQINDLVKIVKSKNLDLEKANQVIARLDAQLGNTKSNQVMTNSNSSGLSDAQWFEIIDIYMFISNIVETAHTQNLPKTAIVKERTVAQWEHELAEVKKMLPVGDKLDMLLMKMEDSLKG